MISQSVGVGSRARNGEKGDLESRKLREIRPCVLQYYLPSITRIVRKRARQREERGKKNGKKSWLSVGVPAHRCSESDPARTSRAGRGKSLAAGLREHGHVPRSGNFVPKRGTGTSWNIVSKCGGTRIIYKSNHRNVSPKRLWNFVVCVHTAPCPSVSGRRKI